jgi:hypothetical protein
LFIGTPTGVATGVGTGTGLSTGTGVATGSGTGTGLSTVTIAVCADVEIDGNKKATNKPAIIVFLVNFFIVLICSKILKH